MLGSSFNRLTVIGIAPRRQKNRPRYYCECKCGKHVDVDHYHLTSGHTKSCGCAKLEIATTRLTTHGHSKSPEYKSWCELRGRCLNSKNARFSYYGGRGITVCQRWSSFENFYSDMGNRPTPAHSIERLDVNGNYEPSNCCWATPKEQQSNRRDTRKVLFRGELCSITEWSRRLGIPQSTLHRWLVRKSLTIEQAVARYESRAS